MEHLPLPEALIPDPVLKIREVADLFRVSISTVTRWAHSGRLIWGRSPGGHFRFPVNQPVIAARYRELEESQ